MKKRRTTKTKSKLFIDIKSRAVRPITFQKYVIEGIAENSVDETRQLVTPHNSRLINVPADVAFSGLELDTGRGTPEGYIRARRRFENGQARVVAITPIVRAHDLFWVKTITGDDNDAHEYPGERRDSRLTLEVISVQGRRVQDLTNADAVREGATFVPGELTRFERADLRNVFAILWDDIHKRAGQTWRSNPWVWVYRFKVYRHNVDSSALLSALQAT